MQAFAGPWLALHHVLTGGTGDAFALLGAAYAVWEGARLLASRPAVRTLMSWLMSRYRRSSTVCTLKIYEIPRGAGVPQKLFDLVERYLCRGSSTALGLVVQQKQGDQGLMLLLDVNQAFEDTYQAARFTWKRVSEGEQGIQTVRPGSEKAGMLLFQLECKHADRSLIVPYLEHVQAVARSAEQLSRVLQVYAPNLEAMHSYGSVRQWGGKELSRNATLATVALPPGIRRQLTENLDTFSKDQAFYVATGRPHKFGMLLFGPPGTGKTSIAIALANHMLYDLYQLDLAAVPSDVYLHKLQATIPAKSVVLFEDIDTVRGLQTRVAGGMAGKKRRRSHGVTLGGLLDFLDGVRTSTALERIVVFTSNHPESLDPALLRSGRMDLHMELPYCSFEVLLQLAEMYLGISEHPLLDAIQPLMTRGHTLTPADVTVDFTRCHRDARAALASVLARLHSKQTSLPQVAATSAATIRATGGVHREVESEFNTDQECLTDFSASEDLPPEDA